MRLIIGLLTLALAFTGCGGGDAPEAGSDESPTVAEANTEDDLIAYCVDEARKLTEEFRDDLGDEPFDEEEARGECKAKNFGSRAEIDAYIETTRGQIKAFLDLGEGVDESNECVERWNELPQSERDAHDSDYDAWAAENC